MNNKNLISNKISEALIDLSPRERDFLRLSLGIDDGRERSLQHIANLFCTTEDEVQKIKDSAISKLKSKNFDIEILKNLRNY